jgi:hypothetical protein
MPFVSFRRRLLAMLLATSIAAVGLGSQIHLHWQGVDPTLRIGSECGHPEPLSSHACLGCKVSHRSLSPPPEVSVTGEPPVLGSRIQASPTGVLPVATHSLSSPRAPPAESIS